MGLVYLALDTRLDRQVAIKCLRTELIEAHYRERFKREALLLAKLNHPHIVQIYDYLETDTQLALVMEYVDGRNLQQHLREHIVPLAQRMQWLTQIAQGLAVAHDAGIIHRDLKAENILINKHKLAKITDLGIAKSQDSSATLTEHVMGSYASMSPEQAMGEELDFRSDLFSFGILAYQLLCGVHPFGETENKLQLMQRIISHPPIPPTKNNPDLPPSVVDLLGQLLSKNPDNRPASTHWVAAQCEKLYQLIATNSDADVDSTQILPHVQTNQSDARNTNSGKTNTKRTQEHPTFETRIERSNQIQRIRDYIKNNSVTASIFSLCLLMTLGVGLWQLIPKEPKYIAVLAPNFTADGMQASQQELIKSTVLGAIQQSLLQLDGYYLIPQDQVIDITGDIETIRKATGADEIISTKINCKIESCTLNFSRLTPDNNKAESRLRVKNTKVVDVLTDNYLSVAEIVQTNIGQIYSSKLTNTLAGVDEKDYAIFIETNVQYLSKGATEPQLGTLDKLQTKTKSLGAVQTLYKDIALDLHWESQNSDYLNRLSNILQNNGSPHESLAQLYNTFYLRVAQNNFNEANIIIERILKITSSQSTSNELQAYEKLAKQDYQNSIIFYKKALESKTTFTNLFNLANSYWYSGDTTHAKSTLDLALKLSPQHKVFSLYGNIEMLEGNIEEAIEYYKKAIERKPSDTLNLVNLGVCYLLKKRYSDAIVQFDLAETHNPKDITLKLNKADALSLKGEAKNAHDIYLNIIMELKDRILESKSLETLAQAYAHEGMITEALTVLQQLEKLDSQNINTTFTSALVNTLSDNHSMAILKISDSLKNGMNKIWFGFPWFDRLCKHNQFDALMKTYGEPNRCTLQ